MKNLDFNFVYDILKANFRKAYVNKQVTFTRTAVIKILESFRIYDDISNPVIQKTMDQLELEGLIKRMYSSELEDGQRIFLYCGMRDPYVEILNDGLPLPTSEIKQLKEVFLAGLARFTPDMPTNTWTKQSVGGLMCPYEAPNSLDDPQIKSILKELEDEGRIKLLNSDDPFLKFIG